MCFANAVLQTMVYCAPFRRLFGELGRLLPGVDPGFGVSTPLVSATIEFLREFAVGKDREMGSWERDRGSGKGKERGEDDEERTDDAFLPTYVYDALKEKKRFDGMRVSCGLLSLLVCLADFFSSGREDIRRMRRSFSGFIWTRSRRSCCPC
jgi:ubiquitin carboxyl-terminal hydrolase 10